MRSTDKVGLVAYPLDLCIVTSLVFSLTAFLIPSKSNSPSGRRSTCEYVTPYSESEPFDGRIPITSSSVSYGFPTGDKSSSPGRRFDISASASACVPHVICGLTSASSPLKQSAYTFSSVSLPRSLYPYPLDILKHSALTLFFCIAFITLSWFNSAFSSIFKNLSFNSSSHFFPKSRTGFDIPSSLYICSNKL